MRRSTPRHRVAGLAPAALPAALGVALLAAACNPFSAPQREEARAVVTAERQIEVRVITSSRFSAGVDTTGRGSEVSVTLERSDTSLVVPRFERTFDISDTRRFYARVEPVDTASVQATLEVFIDDESLGRLAGDLQNEPLEDVYLFQEF